MYRLIVVDDEAIVRDGISRCISWEDNGYQLIGVFEHGVQALEFIRNNPVDAVISDINMPRMDGLELSRIISREFPEVFVLILTGYDDFEYAQEAVTYHVREFLLKPITVEELEQVLKRMRKELDERKNAEQEQELMKQRLEQSFPLLRERFLYRLVSGRIDREVIQRRKEFFQWSDVGGCYQIIVVGIPAVWNELDRLRLQEQIKEEISADDEIFADREENLVLLLQGENPAVLKNRAAEIARQIYLKVSSMKKEQIATGGGQVVDDIMEAASSYKGALNALDYQKVLGSAQIVFIDEIRSRKTISPEGFNALTGRLLDQLKSGSSEGTKKALDEIFAYMEEHYLTINEASYYFIRLHSVLLYFLQEMELFRSDESVFSNRPHSFHSLNDAHNFFESMIEAIEERIHERRQDLLLSRLDKARKIIAERYADPQFSLTQMCEELFLSSSQFSVLFKEGTGRTFIEYLTAFRINEAKKLLKTTDLKSYEVAEKVGYTDPRYFSLIFRKQTNMTPIEFRRSSAR